MNGYDLRIGIGYDIHPLAAGRRLVLGGVEIRHTEGLAGHSDADALVHAICDALLGAVNLGDLGEHFPETEEYRDASSVMLLGRVAGLVRSKGFGLVNADCIVHAERPILSPYRKRMAETVAAALGVPPEKISIKFTKGEGMGSIGRGEAIAARAVVLMRSDPHEAPREER
jgi:2-C-methyl-D-erythritol 2,4-cyclodiphosphate synthase